MSVTMNLGPATEARLAAAFAAACVITEKACAAVLGVDVGTLSSMNERGIIRAVRRGNLPGYTEADLRAYLTESPGPCRSTKEKTAPTGTTTSRSNVVGITARRALKRSAQQRP